MFRKLMVASALCMCAFMGAPEVFAQTAAEKPLASFCDGKYSDAATAVDNANRLYGTLYSGGNYYRTYSSNLEDTINLYRTIQGFEPLKTVERKWSSSFSLRDFKPTAPALTKALRLMTWPDPEMDAEEIQNNIILLDILTSLGPADDWWLRIDDFDLTNLDEIRRRYLRGDEAAEYLTTHVTGTQRIVADFAKRHEELDWLQSALILSTYTHPWTSVDGTPISPDLAALFDHIEKQAGGGILDRAWLSLLSHHEFYEREVPPALAEIQRKIASDIEDCSAYPSDYAALIAGNYPISDAATSEAHLDFVLEIEARNVTFRNKRTPVFDAKYHADISSLKNRAHDKKQMALPLILSALSLAQLEDVTRLNPDVTRPLIILSGGDLENISPGAAFTRHISMKRPAEAGRVLDMAIAKRPELRPAIADILDGDLPQDIQMLMVTLRLRCLSHFISDFCTLDELAKLPHLHRDIDENYSTSGRFTQTNYRTYESKGFIQAELDAWVFPDSARWSPSRYYLHNSIGEAEDSYYPTYNRRRATTRESRPQGSGPSDHPALSEFSSEAIAEYKAGTRQAAGLMALADWAEFDAITGERRLTRAVSLDIINWGRTAPADPVMAEALHRVVRLNKHQSGGELDGKPVGQVAFEILHKKFPNSEWAKRTPYWWPPRRHR